MTIRQRILIVEDDSTFRELLNLLLGKQGYDVTPAGSAKQMHQCLGSGTYDLVLLDLGLPDEHGLTLVRALCELTMPVRVLTGNQDQDTLISALEAGATDYLKKPFDPRELILRVNRVLLQLQLEKKLREQAITDGLTGLSNRRAFQERLEQEWRRTERIDGSLALVLLDVDFFKLYNDRFGHGAGDECLRKVAGVLSDRRRDSDLAARIGGEEFCLILPNTDWDGALVVAEMIRSGVETLHVAHPDSPHGVVTVSIGAVASKPRLSESAVELLKVADQALYEAKASGRNRVAKARPDSGRTP